MDAPDNWNLRDDWKERASRSFVQDVVGVMKWVDGDVNLPKTISDAYFSPIRLLGLQSRQSAAYKGIMALILKTRVKILYLVKIWIEQYYQPF